ncbi:MAG: GNAT family N-acetyltransferase [Chlamydiales bacterium]|nr:GNAT family N-acetyltransferase [Chlamydiales bacterium]
MNPIKSNLQFSVLSERFILSDFDCQEPLLNDFLIKLSFQNQERRLSITTVMHQKNSLLPIGYYSICPCHINSESLPKSFGGNLPKKVPAIRLARLGIDKNFHGMGLGKVLLAHALKRCYYQSVEFGGYVVLIDVKNEKARSFYEHFGSLELIEKSPTIMGIRTKKIEKTLLHQESKSHIRAY